jgi:hypothetical protein
MYHVIEFSNEELSTIAKVDLGWMKDIPQKEVYDIHLTHDQISELERLVRGYTEALAQYNTLSPGKQMTLDILNEVWAELDQAMI